MTDRLNGISECNDGDVKNGRENMTNGAKSNGYYSEKLEIGASPRVVAEVKRTRSFMELCSSTNTVLNTGRNERKVLVIYTGGTIGMVKNGDGGNYIFNLLFVILIY